MTRALPRDKRVVEFLDLLKANADYSSGQSLARKAGISRSAVWKHIRRLRRLGYRIESLHGKGYRLESATENPVPWELARVLKTSFVGKNIIYRESTQSTQSLAIALAEKPGSHGAAVIAEQQTGGRGRLKRKWLSPMGGIWISVILKPSIPTAASTMLPFVAAVAVCDAVREATDLDATLKWPNDVMVKGKKVAGILLDLSAEADAVNYAVIGIGINANVDTKKLHLEREGRPAITSLSDELGHDVNRLHLTRLLLEKLEQYVVLLEEKGSVTIVALWRKRTDMLGRQASVVQQNKVISGMAKDVGDDGSLVLATAAGDVNVVSGDVTVSY
ncbi:biotin--[acetyl-CoA-carboxylase] ligase [Nitrososphaera sp.]|uniref:biotin--[acetyl-CoA-carboxylase] ligase n=1 Tax=Nitrososphaera sp. TaxID=1971748 RepID=UPI002ED7C0BB